MKNTGHTKPMHSPAVILPDDNTQWWYDNADDVAKFAHYAHDTSMHSPAVILPDNNTQWWYDNVNVTQLEETTNRSE